MTCLTYIDRKFSPETEKVIEVAEQICADYMAQGYTLTLRQLYYQFVSRDLIPNTERSYKRLGDIINSARLAGRLDWEAIEDRTRHLRTLPSWDSPRDILRAVSEQFRYDPWDSQDVRIEVWIEKDALVGVIEPVCNRYRVPFFACRGYSSQSEQWRAGRRFGEYNAHGQRVLVLHLGDHDPSGIDMTRDNQDRLQLFSDGGEVEVRRIALNMDQVRRYRPPPNPAKLTDARASGYVERFGDKSWELDALEPRVITQLLETEFDSEIDNERWRAFEASEKLARAKLAKLAKDWRD